MKLSRISFLFLLLFLGIPSFALAQKPIVVGTWSMEFRPCQKRLWESFGQITFLSNGKVDGDSYGSSFWKLRGNNVRIFAPSPHSIVDSRLMISGRRMTGTADIGAGMPYTYCVRLTRL